jgi:hypothetical protein
VTEPSVAPEHAAPPAYQPLSGGAVTALVLALLFAIPALIGVWWLEVVPLVIVALVWSGVSSGRRRGKVVAIVAAAVAVTVGAWAYVAARAITAEFESKFDQLMTALEQGDRKELATWVVEGPDRDAIVERCLSTYGGLRGRFGPYASRAKVQPSLWGPALGAVSVPEGVVDAVDPSRAVPGLLRAVWFEAAFPKARVWVAGMLFGDGAEVDEKDMKASMEAMKAGGHIRFRDLRFFVEAPD